MHISIYNRETKVSKKDNKAPIEVCLNDGNKRIYFKTAYRYNPTEFSKLRHQRKNNEVKEVITALEKHFFRLVLKMENMGMRVTADTVKECWDGINRMTIRDLTDEYNESLKPRVGNDLCWSQYQKYLHVFDELNKIDKPIDEIIESDIEEMVNRWSLKYKPSTFNGLMAKVRTVFRYAISKGYIRTNPCFNIKKKKIDETVETITDEQYKRIKAHEFVGRIENIKEILILLAGTGLSYCDLKNFNPDNIKVENGITIYHNKRQKTGQAFYSIILPDALEILSKYNFNPSIPSNQKLNAYLKEIQDICNIDINITCHKLRHFYTRKLLLMGLPIEVIQKTLGHSQVKMTSHYAHLLQEQNITFVSNAFSQILNK